MLYFAEVIQESMESPNQIVVVVQHRVVDLICFNASWLDQSRGAQGVINERVEHLLV